MDDYDLSCNEFYWDRSPVCFSAVLTFYRAGRLHVSHEVCIKAFLSELEFWRVDSRYLAPCCADRLDRRLERLQEDLSKA